MRTILEELHSGSIHPIAEVPHDPDYRIIRYKMNQLLKTLEKQISAESYKLVEEIIDLNSQTSSMEIKNAFVYGFKLATLIMIEVTEDRDKLI